MWTAQHEYLEPSGSLQLRYFHNGSCISYAQFLHALEEKSAFRDMFLQEMRDAPFSAFRWETPPVSTSNIDQPFTSLIHNSPDLDVRADLTDFESYFQADSEVVCFQNLGADALLVVPCPTSTSANYSHIASFHRSAQRAQQHAFWVAVAQAVRGQLNSQPLWLSTAGGGVDWLHIRLDEKPKYYRHMPWRRY